MPELLPSGSSEVEKKKKKKNTSSIAALYFQSGIGNDEMDMDN